MSRRSLFARSPALQTLALLLASIVVAGILAAAHTGSAGGVLLLPIAATLGPWVGLTSDAPYFTTSFRLALLGALTAAVILAAVGWRFRARLLGRLACVAAVWVWTGAGLVGFGPQ